MIYIAWILSVSIIIGLMFLTGSFTAMELVLTAIVLSFIWLTGVVIHAAANFRAF